MVDSRKRKIPPPLPRALTDLGPAVIVGTVLWLVAAATCSALYLLGHTTEIWLTTALAGFTLGMIGMPIVIWQRRASRRGSRGAQRGL